MFCSQCGVKACGKFCHQCGSLIHTSETVSLQPDAISAREPEDWEQDAVYDNIVRVEAVRSAIAHHAATAPEGVSGEALLAIYDKVVSSPVPLERVVAVVQPLYDSWGIRCVKERSELVETPIGRAIARTLCSFAKHGQPFQRAEQFESGCVLAADLPSSICALKGKLTIVLKRRDQQTEINATTTIPGQLYDWGKSHRCLDQLFIDLKSDLGLPPGTRQRKVA